MSDKKEDVKIDVEVEAVEETKAEIKDIEEKKERVKKPQKKSQKQDFIARKLKVINGMNNPAKARHLAERVLSNKKGGK